jgi:hypothetical protein
MYPEDGGNRFLRKARKTLKDYAASHPNKNIATFIVTDTRSPDITTLVTSARQRLTNQRLSTVLAY